MCSVLVDFNFIVIFEGGGGDIFATVSCSFVLLVSFMLFSSFLLHVPMLVHIRSYTHMYAVMDNGSCCSRVVSTFMLLLSVLYVISCRPHVVKCYFPVFSCCFMSFPVFSHVDSCCVMLIRVIFRSFHAFSCYS